MDSDESTFRSLLENCSDSVRFRLPAVDRLLLVRPVDLLLLLRRYQWNACARSTALRLCSPALGLSFIEIISLYSQPLWIPFSSCIPHPYSLRTSHHTLTPHSSPLVLSLGLANSTLLSLSSTLPRVSLCFSLSPNAFFFSFCHNIHLKPFLSVVVAVSEMSNPSRKTSLRFHSI